MIESRFAKVVLRAATALTLAFIYVPLAVIALYSFTEVQSASRAPGLSSARPNHRSVTPSIGQFCVRRSLKA